MKRGSSGCSDGTQVRRPARLQSRNPLQPGCCLHAQANLDAPDCLGFWQDLEHPAGEGLASSVRQLVGSAHRERPGVLWLCQLLTGVSMASSAALDPHCVLVRVAWKLVGFVAVIRPWPNMSRTCCAACVAFPTAHSHMQVCAERLMIPEEDACHSALNAPPPPQRLAQWWAGSHANWAWFGPFLGSWSKLGLQSIKACSESLMVDGAIYGARSRRCSWSGQGSSSASSVTGRQVVEECGRCAL